MFQFYQLLFLVLVLLDLWIYIVLQFDLISKVVAEASQSQIITMSFNFGKTPFDLSIRCDRRNFNK